MNYIIKQCTTTNLHYASIRPNIMIAKYTTYVVLLKTSTKEDYEEGYVLSLNSTVPILTHQLILLAYLNEKLNFSVL